MRTLKIFMKVKRILYIEILSMGLLSWPTVAMQNRSLGPTVSDQHNSIVNILIGNKIPRPEMNEALDPVIQSYNSFQSSFNFINDFQQQYLIDSFKDGAMLKEWVRDHLMETSKWCLLYKEIGCQLNHLKDTLFASDIATIRDAVSEILAEGDPEKDDDLQEGYSKSLIINILTFMDEVDSAKSGDNVYACIKDISNDETSQSVYIKNVFQYLFQKLYTVSSIFKYELQTLKGKLEDIIPKITDHVFMDNVLERIEFLEKQLKEIGQFFDCSSS